MMRFNSHTLGAVVGAALLLFSRPVGADESSRYHQGILDRFPEELQQAQHQGDPSVRLRLMQDAARAHQYFGRFSQAQTMFRQVLDQARASGNRTLEEEALGSLTIVQSKFGDFQGIQFLKQQLQEQRLQATRSPSPTQATTGASEDLILKELSGAYFFARDLQNMLAVYATYLPRVRAKGDYETEAALFHNLAMAYARIQDYDRAIALLNQSAKIHTIHSQSPSPGPVLGKISLIGELYEHQHKNQDALAWYGSAFDIANTLGNAYWVVQSLQQVGWNLGQLQKFDPAQSALTEALAVAQKHRETTDGIWSRRSLVAAKQGQWQQALDWQQRCSTGFEDLAPATGPATGPATSPATGPATSPATGPATPNHVCAYDALGYIQFHLQDYAAAERSLQKAIAHFQAGHADRGSLNLGRTSADQQRLAEQEALEPVYRLLQATQVAQNRPWDALVTAEMARGQALLHVLQDDPTPSLNRPPRPTSTRLEELQAVARTQQLTLVEYSLLYAESPPPSGIYSVGLPAPTEATQLLIWVIQPDGKLHFRQVDLRTALATLSSPSSHGTSVSPFNLSQLIDRSRRILGLRGNELSPTLSSAIAFNPIAANQASIPKPSSGEDSSPLVQTSLQQLHRILIAPIADLLPRNNPGATVAIVPQGPLFLVPFGLLQDSQGRYLIEKHTLLSAPSIQILAQVGQRTPSLTQTKSGRVSSLPKLSPDPALIVGNPKMPPLRPDLDVPATPLASLPGAEVEARTIAQLLRSTPLIGEAATERQVRDRLPQARWAHFATHGILDNFLGLQAAIALTPDSATSALTDTHDGFLTAREIMGLPLQADLVVLSACNTGRGEITGDGVDGLARAFLGAGAQSVVASLWAVPDQSTTVLMQAFYTNLQRGQSRPQALRQAMLTTKQEFPDPVDWAGFVLIGAPR